MSLALEVSTRVTATDRMHATDPFMLDDLIFLPPDTPIDQLIQVAGWAIQQAKLSVPTDDPRIDTFGHLPHLMSLRADYLAHVARSGHEPAYTSRLRNSLIAHLRRFRILSGHDRPIFHACSRLPLTGAEYVVVRGGLVEECVETFRLRRLAGIAQMGFLHDQVAGDQIGRLHQHGRFAHTRFDHVMNVMALSTLIGHNCGLHERDLLHLRVAALTHDAMTPAGGDTTKEIDPSGLCEDTHYARLFERHDCTAFLKRHGLDTALLTQIVQGKGVLGQLLNVADKCGYTARDVDVYLHRCMVHLNPPAAIAIGDAAAAHEAVCSIWDAFDAVTDSNGSSRVACSDPDRLYHFLHLRALMFRHVYYDTDARSREFVMTRMALQYLYRSGAVTYDHLQLMTDAELLDEIEHHVGSFRFTQPNVRVMRAFCTREEAEAYRALLASSGHTLTFIYTVPRISSGTGFHVYVNGRVCTFSDFDPHRSAHLESITHHTQPYRVYGIPGS